MNLAHLLEEKGFVIYLKSIVNTILNKEAHNEAQSLEQGTNYG